jgi:hypothetical protein
MIGVIMQYFTPVISQVTGKEIKDLRKVYTGAVEAIKSLTEGLVKSVSVAFERNEISGTDLLKDEDGNPIQFTPKQVEAHIAMLDTKLSLRSVQRTNSETGEIFQSYFIAKPMVRSGL